MNATDLEDLISIPRGLLGSARYALRHKCDAPNTYAKLGEYVYPNGNTADVDVLLAADRSVRALKLSHDIKAANLQLLVEKVLEYGAFASQFEDGPPYDNAGKDADNMWDQLLDLARSIKQ